MRRLRRLLTMTLCACPVLAPASTNAPLQPFRLGVIVNDADPLSVATGEFHARVRRIGQQNVIHVDVDREHDKSTLDSSTFKHVFGQLKVRSDELIGAHALTYVSPCRANCMSIASIFTFGYALRHCANGYRATAFSRTQQNLSAKIPVAVLHAAGARDNYDVVFYFTGARTVPFPNSDGFMPGSIADHLTSSGRKLPKSRDEKFPPAEIISKHYLTEETHIKAYRGSSNWPEQGIFLGEPLAKPYAIRATARTADG